jgi:ribosomal-protein-alanine N-acetyltransferase
MPSKARFPETELDAIQLRKPHAYDAAAIWRISNDPAVMEYYGMSAYHSVEEAQKEIHWFQNIFRNNEGIRWIITVRGKREYIGDIGLHNHSHEHHRAEIGFKLMREYWRKGIMKNAIKFVNHYGFTLMKLNRIEAVVDPRNLACVKTLENSGFKQEGLLRQYELEEQGFVDLVMLSLLHREWAGMPNG